MGLLATLRVGPGEAQHKGCSLIGQLVPVKRARGKQEGGEVGAQAEEEVWSFIQLAHTTANLY